MFKNKNKVTKVSNGILLIMFVLSLISTINIASALLTGNLTSIEGYEYNDYLYNGIVMAFYMILTGLALLILNKKVNIYKEEYSLSHQIFNLLLLFLFISSILAIISIGASMILKVPLISYTNVEEVANWKYLVSTVFAYVPVYIYAYYYINKTDFLSKENTKRTNVINFIVAYLMMTYVTNAILYLFNLAFRVGDIIVNIQGLTLSFMWIFVVLLAYKLINTDKKDMFKKKADSKKEEVVDKSKKKEVKVIKTVKVGKEKKK